VVSRKASATGQLSTNSNTGRVSVTLLDAKHVVCTWIVSLQFDATTICDGSVNMGTVTHQQ
jgi:hypothetical protein